jgi:DNA-binding beta-propeller fold protein YncE
MRRSAVAGLAVLAAVSAGCSASSAPSGSGSSPRTAVAHARPVGVTTAAMPGCTTATQPASQLPASDVALTNVTGAPFGVAADGHWSFVGLGGEVGVFRTAGRGVPSLVRQVTVPVSFQAGALLGDTITPDGRYLLVADGGNGAVVLSARAAEAGSPHAVLGVLAGPAGIGGAIEVAVSPDARFAFVSLEDAGKIAVFNLQRALADGFSPADYVGSIPAQLAPVGLAFSPDGRWLYSTSEIIKFPSEAGSLSVIDAAKAETDPAHSVVSRVPAGCNPVRVITSANGSTAWVTARQATPCLRSPRAGCEPIHATLCWPRSGSGKLPSGSPWSGVAPGSW